MPDERSRREVHTPRNDEIGTGRFNDRVPVDGSPVDTGWDPIRESYTPTRRPFMPIALESLGQYGEWSDGFAGGKQEFSSIVAGGSPRPDTPSRYNGDWLAFDPLTGYRLLGIG